MCLTRRREAVTIVAGAIKIFRVQKIVFLKVTVMVGPPSAMSDGGCLFFINSQRREEAVWIGRTFQPRKR